MKDCHDIHDVIIRLENVGMEWQHHVTLHDVNIDVHKGDFMAITGPNGGGKTTLLRIMLKLLKPSSGEVIYYDHGNVVSHLPIGYLPQKNLIDSRFPMTVNEVVASGLEPVKGFDKKEKKERVRETLVTVGLQDFSSKPIGTLSGGQLQRTLLGRAIISKPKLLVLDEPLSYVDKHFEHKIYDLVSELAKSTTIILVSHEMSTIAGMANRHIIVDRNVHECSAAHHLVHYDCDEDTVFKSNHDC